MTETVSRTVSTTKRVSGSLIGFIYSLQIAHENVRFDQEMVVYTLDVESS